MLTTFWMAAAELPLDVQTARKHETRFINEIRQATPLRFGAQEALLMLTKHRRGRPLMAETEEYVMELARRGLDQGDPTVMVGSTSHGATIRYLEILQAAQADADDIAFDAALFFCRRTEPGCGSDIRRLGVYLLNPFDRHASQSRPRHSRRPGRSSMAWESGTRTARDRDRPGVSHASRIASFRWTWQGDREDRRGRRRTTRAGRAERSMQSPPALVEPRTGATSLPFRRADPQSFVRRPASAASSG